MTLSTLFRHACLHVEIQQRSEGYADAGGAQMGGVVPRRFSIPRKCRCFPWVRVPCRFVYYLLTRDGRGGAWYEIATAAGATVGNRHGIDVTSVNEGANIACSIVTIITAENWPIVVYARIMHHFSTFPYVKSLQFRKRIVMRRRKNQKLT